MPIYEYLCKECDHCFEYLVFSEKDPVPSCPQCRKNKVKNSYPPDVSGPKVSQPEPAGLSPLPVPLQAVEVSDSSPGREN